MALSFSSAALVEFSKYRSLKKKKIDAAIPTNFFRAAVGLQMPSAGPPCSSSSGGWPPQDGYPPEALWRAAGAMFVGYKADIN